MFEEIYSRAWGLNLLLCYYSQSSSIKKTTLCSRYGHDHLRPSQKSLLWFFFSRTSVICFVRSFQPCNFSISSNDKLQLLSVSIRLNKLFVSKSFFSLKLTNKIFIVDEFNNFDRAFFIVIEIRIQSLVSISVTEENLSRSILPPLVQIDA